MIVKLAKRKSDMTETNSGPRPGAVQFVAELIGVPVAKVQDLVASGVLRHVTFQARTAAWVRNAFGYGVARDRRERALRFAEEALELAQATGELSHEDAEALVRYVWDRPSGAVVQEVGGVLVTLAALCDAHEIDMQIAAEAELARCERKIEEIRAKHAAKPESIRGAA